LESRAPLGREVAVLYLAILISRIGFGVIIILFPLYIAKSTDIQTAVSLALYPALEAVSALPFGRLCDTGQRRTIFVFALAYMAALIASVGLTQNLYVVSGIHALMGVGAAGLTVASLAMITDLTGTGNRGRGMGAFNFANIGGYAIGLFLGGRLEGLFSRQLGLAFFATGGAVGLAFLMALALLREPVHKRLERGVSSSLIHSLDSKGKATLPLSFGVTVLLGFVFFLPRALTRAGLGGGTTANLLFVGVVVLGVGSVAFGALSDKIGRVKVMVIGAVGLMGLLVSIGVTFAGGVGAVLRTFPVIGVFAILTSALLPSILATAGDRARLDLRGSAMSLFAIVLSIGSALGTLIAGVAHSALGLPGIFDAAAITLVGACLVSYLLWRRAPNNSGGKPL
jgi:MFS family permease